MNLTPKSGDPLDPEKFTLAQWWNILRLGHMKAIVATIATVLAAAFWLGKAVQENEQKRLVSDLEEQLAAERQNLRTAIEAQNRAAQDIRAQTQKQNEEMQARLARGLPASDAPSNWNQFRGFGNLPGTWRGTLQDGQFVVDIKPPEGDQIIAKFRSYSTNCQATLRMVRATDDQLTTSNFFFKPTVATPTCPEIESMMLRPFETVSDFRMVTTEGRPIEAKLIRKV